LISQKTKAIFDSCDFILSPTTPHTAFEIGQINDDPTKAYLEDIFTVHANLTGCPAISLPISKPSNGFPFGLQLMAPSFQDSDLLSFSKYLMNEL